MKLPDRHAWLFSLRTFAAAITALYVAMAGNLSRPYWAMATVYIVSQPLLGPTRAKGVYRILGTLGAGAATLLLLPTLVETPLLLSSAMALWLALCLFLSLRDRGPRGYAFLLAGYTTAFIGFPAVTSPESVFDTVVARSEEIVLGTVIAVLFATVLFPASVRPLLRARLAAWRADAAMWCRQILSGGDGEGPRNRLAADLVQFETLIDFIRHEEPHRTEAAAALQDLRERLLLLLPVLSSIDDRLRQWRAGGTPVAALEALLADITVWLTVGDSDGNAAYPQLRARLASLTPRLDQDGRQLLLASLLLRLQELLDLWQDARAFAAVIEHGQTSASAAPPHYRIRMRRSGAPARHVDYGMITFSALSAGAALMGYCLLWIGIGWEGGGMGAMMAAVTSAFFAAQDDPAPSMIDFLLWATVASLVAFVYQFALFPAIHDFVPLVLLLAVAFLPLGLGLHRPSSAVIALPLTVNLAALLSVQNTFNPDLQNFVNSALSMIVGIGFAVVMTRLFRSVGAEWSARRLLRQGWATLAAAAAGRGVSDRRNFTTRMLDLLGLLAPRLAATSQASELASVDMLGEIRVGLNILQLRRARLDLPPSSRQALDAILSEVAAHYRRQVAQHRPLPAPTALRQHLDRSLARLGGLAAGKARDESLLGLVGLRQALFGIDLPGQTAPKSAPA